MTSALDPQLVGEVLDTMRMLSSEGMAMVVVTHEIRFARDVSHRVAFVREGLIHEIGPPEQVSAEGGDDCVPKVCALRHVLKAPAPTPEP